MAIRIGPPPMLARLRLHWHVSYSYYQRQTRAVEQVADQYRNRLGHWRRDVTTYFGSVLNRNRRQLARRQAQYACFVERYEDLITVLCWAAKDGDHTDRDAKYACIREWMQLNYHKVRPQLRKHLEARDDIFDPFEELFASECIDEIINDSGTIANFMCTRSALDAYGAALEAEARIH